MNSSRSTSPGCIGGSFFIGALLSVVVDDLNTFCAAVLPDKANSNSAVHPDRMLPGTVLLKAVQLVSGRTIQIPQLLCGLDHPKLAATYLNKVGREALGTLALVDRLRHLVPKAPDRHGLT